MAKKRFRRSRFSSPVIRKFNIIRENTNKIAIAIVIGLVLVAAGILLAVTGRNKVSDIPALMLKKEIVVGISTENDRFASVDDSGRLTGYEPELAELILGSLCPDASLKFVHIEDQEASYLLRAGKIDIAFAMLVPGNIKAQGLSLSSAYYQDDIAVYSTESRANEGISSVGGTKVFYVEAKKQSVSDLFESQGVKNVRLLQSGSYPDAVISVTESSVYAVAAPRHKGEKFLHSLYEIPTESSVTVPYSAAVWTTNSSFMDFFNAKLAELSEENADLKKRWGI